MGAIDRLAFNRRIPPGVKEDDVAGGSEIEAEAAGAEGNQEDGGAFSVLKLFHEGLAIFRFAGEQKGTPLALPDGGADEVEHPGELREDEDLVAFFHQRLEEIEQGGELRAFACAD